MSDDLGTLGERLRGNAVILKQIATLTRRTHHSIGAKALLEIAALEESAADALVLQSTAQENQEVFAMSDSMRENYDARTASLEEVMGRMPPRSRSRREDAALLAGEPMVFQRALEEVGNALGCVGAFTPQDVIDVAKQIARHAQRATDNWHRAEAAEASRDAIASACEQVLSWLESFSMPPTSTIHEKQEHIAILEKALGR